MLVRLTQKLADCIDGIDLSRHGAGQIIELPDQQAALLIAEGWAAPAGREFSRARSRCWEGACHRHLREHRARQTGFVAAPVKELGQPVGSAIRIIFSSRSVHALEPADGITTS